MDRAPDPTYPTVSASRSAVHSSEFEALPQGTCNAVCAIPLLETILTFNPDGISGYPTMIVSTEPALSQVRPYTQTNTYTRLSVPSADLR
jgi:hypothetical protein